MLKHMSIQDYTDVHALWSRTPGLGLRPIEDSLEGISFYLNRNPKTCFTAWEDGKLVGAILAGHDGRRGYLYHLAVDSAYRRKGIGRQLVEQSLAALSSLGIQKVALVAFTYNQNGNVFWEKMGFSQREDLTYRNRTTT